MSVHIVVNIQNDSRDVERGVRLLPDRANEARTHAESARRQSEEMFQQIARTIEDVFWMATPDRSQFKYVSPAFEALWGVPCDQLYANPDLWIEALHLEDRERVRDAVSRNQKPGVFDEVYRIVRPDGSTSWIRDRASAIRDESGAIVMVTGVAADISMAKSSEEELRKSEERLRHAQEMDAIGRLAGGIAHDFNNLLSVILGYLEFMLEELKPDDPLREMAMTIEGAGQRAAALVKQLLAFSRKQVVEPRVVDVNSVVHQMDKFLVRAIGEDMELVLASNAKGVRIFIDQGQLEQVLMNLVVNARDAMPGGGKITVDIDSAAFSADPMLVSSDQTVGNYVLISVSDTERGMDEATKKQIFDPFFTTKEPGRGTGLGLATVSGIVTAANGFVRSYSELGVGTTFKILLPQVETEVNPVQQVPRSVEVSGGHETILVVDDEPSIADLLRLGLVRKGYRVFLASSGLEALDILRANPVQLV